MAEDGGTTEAGGADLKGEGVLLDGMLISLAAGGMNIEADIGLIEGADVGELRRPDGDSSDD